MQINTNLNQQDYIRAYKTMCRFIINAPLLSVTLCLFAGAITMIPFAYFPLKTGALGGLVSLVIICVSVQYREGSLSGLLTECRYQQRLFLPAVLVMTTLSWLAYLVVAILPVPATLAGVDSSPSLDATATVGCVFGAALILVGQLMPYVLAHFCHSLNLTRQQGEHIWLALMLRWKTLFAFVPMALLVPLSMLLQRDIVAFILLLATVYCTFLMFIVFNISPRPRAQRVTSHSYAAQGA